MGCCPGVVGIAAAAFGIGILIGGLLPTWFVVWILGIVLIIVGLAVLIARACRNPAGSFFCPFFSYCGLSGIYIG